MKIITTNRPFNGGMFMDGTIEGMKLNIHDDNSELRGETAYGIVFDGRWYELEYDDNPANYVLIETDSTNRFGFHDGGKSTRELVTESRALEIENMRHGAGVVNQIAKITVNDDKTVDCTNDIRCIFNRTTS